MQKMWCKMKTRLLIIIGICMVVITTIILGANFMSERNDQRELLLDQSSIARESIPESEMTSKTKDMLSSKYTGISDVEKLLVENQIDYLPDKLVVTRGPTYYGDPGCGAVIDVTSETHWFEIDSISNPKNMTLYSENPRACTINHSSCFCNAQTELTEITLNELSYFTTDEEEQVGKRVQTYFETIPHLLPLNKFVVGKYNLNLGDQYTEICGAIITESDSDDVIRDDVSVYSYFSGAMDGPNLWDFSLGVNGENLCAISTDAKIFEYEKSGR